MRTARPVGLSQDGKSLLVATSSGEELAIPVDDRLHAALRGDQPRLGQLEIEMENALGPRDIQSKIRSGSSLDEVSRIAGMPLDRVERWAAPVLAEREHVALLAMSSSVRKRGETSGHRLLRVAVTERLQKRGVDIDTVDWDSYRQEDGRWSVSATYRSGESSRTAEFVFDLQGRFSVAGNDEARWVLQEQSSVKGPQPGRRRPAADDETQPDTEPTLDLSDELALVRVIQPDGADDSSEEEEAWVEAARSDGTWIEQDISPTTQPAAEPDDDDQSGLATVRDLYAVPERVRRGDRFGEQPAYEELPPSDGGTESPLETLASMLRGDEDPAPEYRGLSDASAVPETDNGGWEPGIVVDYPVEPSPEEPDETGAEGRSEALEDTRVIATGPIGAREVSGEPTLARASVLDEQTEVEPPAPAQPRTPRTRSRTRPAGTDVPAPPDPIVDGEDRAEEAEALADQQSTPAPEPASEPVADKPAAKSSKRKRAAVPSWDEIMFGGPSRPK